MRRFALFIALILTLTAQVSAAPGFPVAAPLAAPLLALDVVAADHITLYDVTNDAYRDLNLGHAVQRVWGFTPDGCRLIFTLGNNPARLYTARLDGSDARELVQYVGAMWGVWDAHMQPNGDRVAFTLIDTDGSGEQRHRIALVNVNGGEPTFLSITGDEHTPRWSADGQWIVYVSYETSPEGSREADLWMVGADGVNKYRMTNFNAGSVSMPRPSPDGDLIGFVYSPSPNNDQFWMIGAQPDALPTQLSYNAVLALDLTWQPDSTAMIAAARDMQGIAENRLWRIPLVGNADSDAAQVAVDAALAYLDYPRYSANWLAFRSEYLLQLLDTSDGSWRTLDNAANTPPVWSPAGFTGEANCPA